MARLRFLTAALVTSAVTVSACGGDHPPAQFHKRDEALNGFVKRQASPTYPTGPAYDVPPLASITPTPVSYMEDLLPVIATYAPGSPAPISGAPPLPAYTIVPSAWPDLSLTPPTTSPEVQEWMQELQGHDIPNIAPNPTYICGDAANAAALAAAGESGQCWWTCGGCLRDTDVTMCKDQWDWGHTYDDGPGFYTNKLLTYLNTLPSNNDIPAGVAPGVKATFFVVGARVISRPEIVVYEYMNNHEISIHTWSHTALTTLTNEQVVAELGWTRKAIRDIIGVTPLTFRPPYGDMDDRVRAIALAMGMRPVIWTASTVGVSVGGSALQWDSQDWRVHSGGVESVPNQASFQAILDSSPQFSNSSSPSYSSTHQGVVVLQHDIYVESVNLAIGYTVPYAETHTPKWQLKTVTECQPRSDGNGKQSLRDAYAETNTDLGNPAWLAIQGNSAGGGTTSVVTSGGTTRTVTNRPTSTGSPGTGAAGAGKKVMGAGAVGAIGALVVAMLF